VYYSKGPPIQGQVYALVCVYEVKYDLVYNRRISRQVYVASMKEAGMFSENIEELVN
jgi:hypothetical protein